MGSSMSSETPTPLPRDLIASITRPGSGAESRQKITESAPASTNGSTQASGSTVIRWTSKGTVVCLRRARTRSGKKSIVGT